jgi:hypothetical protein
LPTSAIVRGCGRANARAASAELAEVLERVRLIKGIAATETSIHLQTYKLS